MACFRDGSCGFRTAPEDEDIVAAATEYGVRIHAAVECGNVCACQFHPEKSGDVGLRILRNFLAM